MVIMAVSGGCGAPLSGKFTGRSIQVPAGGMAERFGDRFRPVPPSILDAMGANLTDVGKLRLSRDRRLVRRMLAGEEPALANG